MASWQKAGSSPRKRRANATLADTPEWPSTLSLPDESFQIQQLRQEVEFWKTANTALVQQYRRENEFLLIENDTLKNQLLEETNKARFFADQCAKTAMNLQYFQNTYLLPGNLAPSNPPGFLAPQNEAVQTVMVQEQPTAPAEYSYQDELASLVSKMKMHSLPEPAVAPMELTTLEAMDPDEGVDLDEDSSLELQYPTDSFGNESASDLRTVSPLGIDGWEQPQLQPDASDVDGFTSNADLIDLLQQISDGGSVLSGPNWPQVEACGLVTPDCTPPSRKADLHKNRPLCIKEQLINRDSDIPPLSIDQHKTFFYTLLEDAVGLLESDADMVGFECVLCRADPKERRGVFPEEVEPARLVDHFRSLHLSSYKEVLQQMNVCAA